MGAIITLFGKSGFDIPLSLLIDADAMCGDGHQAWRSGG